MCISDVFRYNLYWLIMCMFCYLEVVILYINMYNVYYICIGYFLYVLIFFKGSNFCSVTIEGYCFFFILIMYMYNVCFFVVICMSEFRIGDNNWL